MSVISFLRRSAAGELALVACNFTPVPRETYRIGVPRGGRWRERLNSDAADYGGSGQGNLGALAHDEDDLNRVLAAFEEAFHALGKAG